MVGNEAYNSDDKVELGLDTGINSRNLDQMTQLVIVPILFTESVEALELFSRSISSKLPMSGSLFEP